MLSRPLRRKRQKLCDVIVESVTRSIVTDALKPGDRLPTERELMESVQCSKGSARGALKSLEVEGLVSTRPVPVAARVRTRPAPNPPAVHCATTCIFSPWTASRCTRCARSSKQNWQCRCSDG